MFKHVKIFTLSKFALALVILTGFESGHAETYVLSQPIEQVTPLTNKIKLAALGADLAVSAGFGTTLYFTTGSPHAVMAAAVNSAIMEIPQYPTVARVMLYPVASWDRRKDLQEIADIPGVEKINLITAGRMENRSYLDATLHSKSMVFINTDGPLSPSLAESGEWQKLDNLEASKLILRLQIGGENKAQPMEITLKDFLDSKEFDGDLYRKWDDQISKWEKTVPFIKRQIPGGSAYNPLTIETSLLINGQEIDLGDLATGKSVKQMLKITPTDKIKRWAQSYFQKEAENTGIEFGPTTIRVEDKSKHKWNCKDIIEAALGRLYLRK